MCNYSISPMQLSKVESKSEPSSKKIIGRLLAGDVVRNLNHNLHFVSDFIVKVFTESCDL